MPTPKPFLIRKTEAFCRGCDRWQSLDDFYDDRSTNAPYHGKRLRCKDCERSRRREDYQSNIAVKREMVRNKKRRAARENRKADRQIIRRAQQKMMLIDITDELHELLQQYVQHLMSKYGEIQHVAFACGMAERQIWSIMNRERKRLEVSTAERIIMAADAEQDIDIFIPAPGIDGWSKKGHRYCQDCGSWDHPHCARGLCERCYMYQLRHDGQLRSESGDMRKGVIKMWAPTAGVQACVICDRSEVRHHSKGFCEACFQRAEKRRMRIGIDRSVADMAKLARLPLRTRTDDVDPSDFTLQ